jgi:hypothetical protein
MSTHLLMAAAAASILLTSAALASSPGPGSGVPHQTRRAGDRYTVVTDNEQLMCKVAGTQSSRSWAPPTDWAHAVAHLRQEGDIRCTPGMTNGSYR